MRQITQSSSGVTVRSDQVTISAKQVIVAIPPALAGRIDYEPILPFQRDQLTQRFGQGTMTKVAAVYKSPFWRDAGLSGMAVTTDGPVTATFDDSPPSGSPGVIFGFVGGDCARQYNAMSSAARKSAVLNQFVTFFGSQAGNAIDFFETSWSGEQWTRGCPVGIPSQARCWPTVRRSASRWAGSTGPAPRRPRTGTGTWTGPCGRASAPRPKRCQSCRVPSRPRRGGFP